eukprot:g3794.t1
MPYSLPGNAAFSPRLRKSPFFAKTLEYGVADFTSYNRMLMPLGFGDAAREYNALTTGVACWDVAAERQVELVGSGAMELAQLLTCRDISAVKDNTCAYAVMCDDDGVVINDPLLLKLADDHVWLSIADSDVLLWAKGIAIGKGIDVSLREPDVSPLALQGPKSTELVRRLFGTEVVDSLAYFHFRRGKQTRLDGRIPITLARSGWSPERGYELYLEDGKYGDELWDMVFEVGQDLGIVPGAPNQQRRVEAGMLSWGGDTLPNTNALELGLPRKFCDPYMRPDFIGKQALQRIAHREGGPARKFLGVCFENPGTDHFSGSAWRGQHLSIFRGAGGEEAASEGGALLVGTLTAQAYSPRFGRNLGLGFLITDGSSPPGTQVHVRNESGAVITGEVMKLPFDRSMKGQEVVCVERQGSGSAKYIPTSSLSEAM